MQIEIELDEHKGSPAINISITHNGNQWSTIRVFTQEEINQLIKALQEFDGLKNGQPIPHRT